ncbi:MAG: hypothetical protein Q4E26_05175 [Prevotellaceae bacterium]|nr:hypothetical protein [Prevotellaceae bacterium]MDO4992332.1 hypothetical protein [Prevotellaceae bacterium]
MKNFRIDLHKAWEIIKKHEHPSKEALDRIALLAGFQTWEELQDAFENQKGKI